MRGRCINPKDSPSPASKILNLLHSNFQSPNSHQGRKVTVNYQKQIINSLHQGSCLHSSRFFHKRTRGKRKFGRQALPMSPFTSGAQIRGAFLQGHFFLRLGWYPVFLVYSEVLAVLTILIISKEINEWPRNISGILQSSKLL